MSDEAVASSWCTAWDSFNTPRLWSMVKDEDDEVGRAQVTAWRTLAGSVRSQREALEAARKDLVEAWPETNASAAAFLMELDTLIRRLDTASADAQTTANGLDRIMNALQSAKKQIAPLWEKYKDKSDDWIPNWFDNAEDELDEQARRVMISTEKAVQDSAVMLKVPEPYRLDVKAPKTIPGQPPAGDGSGSARTGSGSAGGAGIEVSVPHDPVPPLPGRDPIVPEGVGAGAGAGAGVGVGGGVAVGGGPDLAGVITPPPLTTLPGGGPVGPLPGGPLPVAGGGGGVPQLPVPGLLPSAFGQPGPAAGGGVRPAAGRVPAGGPGRVPFGGTGGVPGGRSVNGIIGGRPEGIGAAGGGGRPGTAARGGLGRSGAGPAPRPSWLPDDRVGPDRHATAPGQAGGARGGRGQRDRGTHADFDPDNPWRVAEGVRPVIVPGVDDDRHDPGPNVIGWRG